MDHADISEWQPNVNIQAYKNGGYQRIAHRATFGDNGIDKHFVERWATFSPLIRQAYHFAYPGSGVTAGRHLDQVVASAGGFTNNDEVMLDLEWFQAADGSWQGLPPAQALQYARDFFAQHAGRRKLVYGNSWYFEDAGITQETLPDVGLIVAAYAPNYSVPDGWDHACFWQFTDAAPFPGLGNVDSNHLTCPNNLAHLGVEDDELNDADWARLEDIVKQAVSDGVKAELTYLLGSRTTPAAKPAGPPTLSNLADALYLMSHGDATHPWSLTALSSTLSDTNSRISNLQTGQVDPASIRAALAGLKVEGTISE